MLLLVGVQLLIPWIVRTLIASVTAETPGQDSLPTITRLVLLALLVYIARAGLQFVRSYMAHVVGWGVVADVRKHIYEHMQRLSLRFYEDKQTGQLMSRVINDTDLFEALIAHAVPDVFVNLITLTGVSLVLFSINWQLTLLSLVPIPLVFVSLRVYARRVRPAFVNRQKELGDLNATLNDNLTGIREIKAFTREEDELTRVGVRVDRYLRSNLNALRLMAIFQPFVEFTSSLGPTGVGKSTLVSLIPRFYDLDKGAITLDGQDLRTITMDSLRRQVSIVLQDVFLFNGTVRENILFGKPMASEEEVIAAAKVANANVFINELPDGYDTVIGERGVKLSGGQKQRLAIARALLKDAPILILDEATSSVDTETEMLIQQALERLMAGRTVILIAHHLSTVRNADQIVVLEGKRIVQKGTHNQLRAQDGGLYQRLYTVQKQLEPVVNKIHLQNL